jgi:hypothetical protein
LLMAQIEMNRPEWIKFTISAIAQKKLDLRKPLDRYHLIFDESWARAGLALFVLTETVFLLAIG